MPALDNTRLLTTVNPVLAKEWHPTFNQLNLEEIYANSGKKAWWQCSTCDYEWEAVIASRNSNGRGCPNCAGKIPNESNSLVSLYPHIAAQYHPTMNLKPVTSLTCVTPKKVWWQCDKMSTHTWEAMVMNRVRQGDGCPYCSGRYATSENNLAIVWPEVAAEFDFEKNAPLTPSNITPASSKKLYWICKVGHSWKTSPCSRVKGGAIHRCPYCAGKKATLDNHIGITHPHIAKQYHYSNKIPIEKIRYGSHMRGWWVCENKHKWEASVSSRTRPTRPTGCPECSPTPRTSKIEVEIKRALAEQQILKNIPDTYNAFIPVAGRTQKEAVDIYGTFNDLKVTVEYDSWWWHSGLGSKTDYSVKEERDSRKTKNLLESGYVVIRVRESRSDTALPLLPVDHPMLLQIAWDQQEGIEILTKKIESYLLTL